MKQSFYFFCKKSIVFLHCFTWHRLCLFLLSYGLLCDCNNFIIHSVKYFFLICYPIATNFSKFYIPSQILLHLLTITTSFCPNSTTRLDRSAFFRTMWLTLYILYYFHQVYYLNFLIFSISGLFKIGYFYYSSSAYQFLFVNKIKTLCSLVEMRFPHHVEKIYHFVWSSNNIVEVRSDHIIF